ncbi:hypothetical protein ACJMK2_040270 [Sinanodonta woodiana]|uniref:DZIP3-like HEPN domain-containing protein n=1 Tax=Sinanodonta woodiana TaxID=1069815 RepID=A0ABD3WEH9_SINWO
MPLTSAGMKVKDPEYKNWLKVGLALCYLKDGLKSFIQNEVDDMHQYLLQKLYGGSAVQAPQCSSCKSKDVKQNRNTYVWKFRSPCPSHLCDIWLAELLTLHINPTYNKIYWDNCDVTAWPFVPWECAKLYMPRGQPTANTGPAMSDSQALLTLMANCTNFHGKFSQPGITLIKKVSTIRNKVMHSGDMSLSDSDRKSFIQDIIDLLEDPTHLRSLEECKQAVIEIHRISKVSVDVFFNLDIEMMALRECVNDCRQEIGVHNKTTEVTVESLKEEFTNLRVQFDTNVKETKDKIADLDLKYQHMESSVKQMDSLVKEMDSSLTTLSSDVEIMKQQLNITDKFMKSKYDIETVKLYFDLPSEKCRTKIDQRVDRTKLNQRIGEFTVMIDMMCPT